MNNGIATLLILVIFFCLMVISVRKLKYKTNEQNTKINNSLWVIKDELLNK